MEIDTRGRTTDPMRNCEERNYILFLAPCEIQFNSILLCEERNLWPLTSIFLSRCDYGHHKDCIGPKQTLKHRMYQKTLYCVLAPTPTPTHTLNLHIGIGKRCQVVWLEGVQTGVQVSLLLQTWQSCDCLNIPLHVGSSVTCGKLPLNREIRRKLHSL